MGLTHRIVPERIRLTFLSKEPTHWIPDKIPPSARNNSLDRQEEVPLPIFHCPLEAPAHIAETRRKDSLLELKEQAGKAPLYTKTRR